MNRRELSTRDARLIVLKVADRFRKTSGLGATGSDHLFCELFEDNKVPLPEWVLDHVKKVSPRTMRRWRDGALTNINRLAHDPANARKGSGVLDRAEDGRVRAYCLAAYASNQFLSAKHIREAAVAEFGETVLVTGKSGQKRVSMPPLRTFQNALKNWLETEKNVLLKITDPDAYKSKVRFVASGANRMDRLNQKWEIDASPSDVMTLDGRMNIYAAIDLYSRRVIILVTKTPRADAVGLLIRKCILAWGVPETIKSDKVMVYREKYAEAKAYQADATAECPMLSVEAAARGIPLADMVQIVLDASNGWVTAAAQIEALTVTANAAIEAARSVEDLDAALGITWP